MTFVMFFNKPFGAGFVSVCQEVEQIEQTGCHRQKDKVLPTQQRARDGKREYDGFLFDDGDTGDNEKEDGQHIGENKDAEADHIRMHGQEHGGQKGDLWLSKEQEEESVKKQIRQQGNDDRKDA